MFYDHRGKLTREGAIKTIQSGGSVIVNGNLYNSLGNLPGEAEFAKGDEQAAVGARERLEQQIRDAQRELDKLAPAKIKQQK